MSVSTSNIKQDLRGTWKQALWSLFLPILILLGLRWILIEPYVIPSGSMIPHLLIHDHIIVNKWSYGLRLPFTEHWLWQWRHPRRGEVVVFRYPVDPQVFFVKRLIGLPGEQIEVIKGVLYINGKAVVLEPAIEEVGTLRDPNYDYFTETLDSHEHVIRFHKRQIFESNYGPVKVPEGHYFMMGDNRDESSDSRVWGFLPVDHLIGRASLIWLSCEDTLPSAKYLCDPKQLRWGRIFKWVQ